jgi:poly(3-hydroxybutyrate) depolymerase
VTQLQLALLATTCTMACRAPFEAGCPFSLERGLNTDLDVLGDKRSATVLAPQTAGPHPVVFVFHGGGGSSLGAIEQLQIGAHADEAVIIGVDARDAVIPIGIWADDSDSTDTNPDLAFFDNLHACALEQFAGDADRISVAGVSAGAFFAGFLVKVRGESLAAAAMFSGIMRRGVDDGDTPMLMSYGGENDRAPALDENGVFSPSFDFTARAREQVPLLRDAGHLVVACNSGEGHGVPNEAGETMLWPFLSTHTRGESSPFDDASSAPELATFCTPTDVP